MPTVATHIPHFEVYVNGSLAPRRAMDDLLECIVENSIHLPDMCSMRIHDAKFEWIDSEFFTIGASIEIRAFDESRSGDTIFWGEVTAQEMDLSGADGVPTVVIRSFDRSHRLHRGRQSRTWTRIKDSEIVQEIGREVGLKVTATSTPQVHDWVIQNNQTNWEFLCERAARNGYRLYLKGERELVFEPVKDVADEVIQVRFGDESLRSFRPRMTAAHQVDEVVVRGWCPREKRTIIGKSTAPKGITRTGDGKNGGQVAKKAFGAANLIVVDRPVHTEAEAEHMAQSILDEIASDFIEADGLSDGNPRILPAKMVEVSNIGNKFSTQYYVTATTHAYTPAEGYTTVFYVTGKSPSTLLAIMSGDELAKRSPLGGNLVIGLVTDNRDPEGLGRVKVMYPWLTNDHTSFWARIVSQMAGSGRGMFNLPEVGDEVLVAFEHGEISRPYVLGQLWNGKDKPPTPSAARTVRSAGTAVSGAPGAPTNNPELGGRSEVNRRGFYTRIGHLIDLDDTGGQGGVMVKTTGGNQIDASDADQKVEIKTPGGHVVIVDDAGQKIELKTTSGHVITMSDAGNNITIMDNVGDSIVMAMGTINITALVAVTVNAPLIAMNAAVMLTGEAPVVNFNSAVRGRFTSLGEIRIDADKDMNIKSKKTIKTEAGANIESKATANMDLHAAAIKLNS